MFKLKSEKGISLIALVVTTIVILILAGAVIRFGVDVIKRAKVEGIVTNLITIKAKAKGYAEEINSQIWNLDRDEKRTRRNELFNSKYNMGVIDTMSIIDKIDKNYITNECVVYSVSKQTLNKMGLEELSNNSSNDEYAVVFELENFDKFDVIYLNGMEYEGVIYWALSSIQSEMEK